MNHHRDRRGRFKKGPVRGKVTAYRPPGVRPVYVMGRRVPGEYERYERRDGYWVCRITHPPARPFAIQCEHYAKALTQREAFELAMEAYWAAHGGLERAPSLKLDHQEPIPVMGE